MAIATDTGVVSPNLWGVTCDRRFWRATACVGAFRFFVYIHCKLSEWADHNHTQVQFTVLFNNYSNQSKA